MPSDLDRLRGLYEPKRVPLFRRADFWRGWLHATAFMALLVAAGKCSAVDLSEYDKQTHASGGALIAYLGADILERTTDWPAWARFLASAAGTTFLGYLYEQSVGFNDPDDWRAVGIGALGGAGGQAVISFTLRF